MTVDAGAPFVTADGVRLAVHSDGEPDSGPDGDPDAPVTLVLVHGWTQDARSWDRVVAALPDDCARVLRPDLRGHGGSAPAPPGTATIERIAEDLAAVLADRVPTGPLVLAGHSMGGAALMALAAAHPEVLARTAGLALVATTSGGLSELTFGLPRRLARQVYRAQAAAGPVLARSRRSVLTDRDAALRPVVRRIAFGVRPDRAAVASMARQIAAAHPASMLGFLDSLLAHERLAALTALREVPAVVLHGDRDRLVPPRHGRVLADALPAARYTQFPGAGHMLMSERPAEVAVRLAGLVSAAKLGAATVSAVRGTQPRSPARQEC